MSKQQPATGRTLMGMDEICAYAGRHKSVIKRWIERDGFPAALIDGRWESNTTLIDKFRLLRIEKQSSAAGQPVGGEHG